jgi:hypothetical protein
MSLFRIPYISFLLAPQPCVGLGLLHGFLTGFSGVLSLAPRPKPNLEDQLLQFIWPLPFDLPGYGWRYQEIMFPPT